MEISLKQYEYWKDTIMWKIFVQDKELLISQLKDGKTTMPDGTEIFATNHYSTNDEVEQLL